MFQTYIHQRADDQQVFYVGKGAEKRAHSTRDRSEHWKRTAAKHGRTVTMCGIWVTEAEAFEHEKFLIWLYRGMGAPLVNKTDGGEGPSGAVRSAETRAKLSASTSASMTPERRATIAIKAKALCTPEHIARMSAAAKAAWTPEHEAHRLEKLRSPETSAKMSASAKATMTLKRRTHMAAIAKAANIGRVCSPETKAKIREAHKGKTIPREVRDAISATVKTQMTPARLACMSAATKAQMTPAHKAKLSAAHKGKVLTMEQRARIAAANTGKKHSPEAKAKMSSARLAVVARKKSESYKLGQN